MIHGVDEMCGAPVKTEFRICRSAYVGDGWPQRDVWLRYKNATINEQRNDFFCFFFFTREQRVFFKSHFSFLHLQTICAIVLFIIHVQPISWMWIWQTIKPMDGSCQVRLICRSLLVRRFGRQRMNYSQVGICGGLLPRLRVEQEIIRKWLDRTIDIMEALETH